MVLTQAQNIIAQSDLSQEDKDLWLTHFDNAPEEAVRMFVELFSEKTEDLSLATDSLKKKTAALGDAQKMKNVMREDMQMIGDAIAKDDVLKKIGS